MTTVLLTGFDRLFGAAIDSGLDSWTVVGNVADVATLFATVLALFGLVTAWLSRPRVTVTADAMSPDWMRIQVAHSKGSNSARNLNLNWGGLNDRGVAMFGDGSSLWGPVLVAGDSGSIEFFDSAGMSYGSEPGPREIRIEVKKPNGLIVSVSWQRPVFSWLRTQRVVLWTTKQRAAGKKPTILRGFQAWRVFKKAMKVE